MNEGESNRPTIHWITRTLCVLGAVCVLTICVMSYVGSAVPSELNTITGIIVGGLLSMLTKSTPSTATPTKMEITNTAANPVPTTEEPTPPTP